MKVLLTGGTGFLGSYLVSFLSETFETVYVLSRKNMSSHESHLPNVKYVQGDITNLDVLSLSDKERQIIFNDVEMVVHAAALYDLEATHTESFLQNVVGTQNVLSMLKNFKNLKAFYYISTIAVGDNQTYFLEEDVLPKREKFSDAYSETKYMAEKIVRDNTSKSYVTRIIRPGIIVGDSKTGVIPKIDGPYYFIEAFKKHYGILKHLRFAPLSFNPKAKLPIIPVDHCARFIVLLMKRDTFETTLKTFHLISSELPTIKEFLFDLNKLFGLKTIYLPVKKNRLHDSLLKLLGIPSEVIPFMFSKLSYDKSNTLEDLPEINESAYGAFKNTVFGKK